MLINKKYSFWVAIAMIVSLLFPSSSFAQREFFLPHEAYLMGLQKKFDLKVGASFLSSKGTADNGFSTVRIQRYNGQIAFSPWNRVGLIASFSKKKGNYNDIPVTWDLQHQEVAIGTYHEFRKTFPSAFTIRANLYAGGGWGQVDEVLETAGELHLKFQRAFVHSGWQLWWKDYFAFSYGLRLVNLHFTESTTIGNVPRSYEHSLDNFIKPVSINYLESSFHLQGGLRQAKLFLSATRPMGTLGNSLTMRYSSPAYKVGLILTISALFQA